MPSKDTFHEENPQTNKWLDESATSRPTAPTSPGSSRASTSARGVSPTKQAAHVQRLAAALGVDAEELAKRIPEDTLRRLKYPALEQADPETGLSRFEHDRGVIRDGRRATLAPDRAHEAIPKGSKGRGSGTEQGRSPDGRFSK